MSEEEEENGRGKGEDERNRFAAVFAVDLASLRTLLPPLPLLHLTSRPSLSRNQGRAAPSKLGE